MPAVRFLTTLLLAVALTLSAGCSPSAPPPVAEHFVTRATAAAADVPSIMDDERAIAEVLLQRACPDDGTRKSFRYATHVVIALETAPVDFRDASSDHPPGKGFLDTSWRRPYDTPRVQMIRPVSRTMLDAFFAASHVPGTIPEGITLACPVLVVPQAELDA